MKNFYVALCFLLANTTNKAIGAEGGMPQLNPEFWPSQIFWLILIFSSLYIIMWKIFLPKISNSIENRKSRVINDLNEAQKLKENAEKKLKEYNKIIEESKKEAKKILEESRKKLNKDLEIKKKKIIEEIEKELIVVETEIKSLKKTSIPNINKIAEDISCELIKEMIGTEINKSNVAAIVENVSKKELEKNI